MLQSKITPGISKSTKRKSFFDSVPSLHDDTCYDLDGIQNVQSLHIKNIPSKTHIDLQVSFSIDQLESIDVLKKLDSVIKFVFAPQDSPVKPLMKESILTERPTHYKDIILDSYRELISKTKKYYGDLLSKKTTTADTAFEIVETISKVFVTDRNIMLNLCNYETDDDFLYQHVVKTAIYAVNISIALGYSQKDVYAIGIGALMSDIGMAAIARRIRNFKGKYSEDENFLVRKHPIFSANILDTLDGFPETTSLIAYQTHERSNGMGYPKGRKEHTLHSFSKIVSIADVYTALSSTRHHRKAFRPFEAIKRIITLSNKGWFSKEIVAALLEYTSLFPVGSIVKLNTNRYAKVISASENSVSHPIITIFTDDQGFRLAPKKFEVEDLSLNTELKIVGTTENYFLSTSLMTGF